MPKPPGKKRPRDANQLAKMVVDIASGEVDDKPEDEGKNAEAVALRQRRRQIVGDCVQLRVDADSYNENRTPEQPIQISLNFTNDVEEELFAATAA